MLPKIVDHAQRHQAQFQLSQVADLGRQQPGCPQVIIFQLQAVQGLALSRPFQAVGQVLQHSQVIMMVGLLGVGLLAGRLVQLLSGVALQHLVQVETPIRAATHQRFICQGQQQFQRGSRHLGCGFACETAVEN